MGTVCADLKFFLRYVNNTVRWDGRGSAFRFPLTWNPIPEILQCIDFEIDRNAQWGVEEFPIRPKKSKNVGAWKLFLPAQNRIHKSFPLNLQNHWTL